MQISSDKNIAIRIKDLSKTYSINTKKTKDVFFALKDISLDIKEGEIVGLIGPNGAGKSTLLKILSEVTSPSSGVAEITGKVASILEVGTGFNPDLNGRKNIYLNARLHGMNKQQVDEKFDEIVEMFGFPDFLDTPVKQYSSGMYMRLAFAVVVHIDADIYLFDEVLSMGDSNFRKKVITKIEELKNLQKTVLFASHNPNEFINVCDKMLSLAKGMVVKYGDPKSVIINEHNDELSGSGYNIHEYIEKTDNRKQILDIELSSLLEPISCKMELNSNGKIFFEFKYVTNYDDISIKNFLIIKDKVTRPIAQIEFKNTVKKEQNTYIETIQLNSEAFGHFLFYFEVICVANKKPAFILPQILQHQFETSKSQIGLIDMDKL